LNIFKPLALENYPPVSVDARTMAFTFGLALLAGLLFGLAPALSAAGINVQDALKSAGPTQSGSRPAVRMRRLLVVLELGMSLVLLIGAALLTRSFLKLANVDLGFRPENLLTLRFNLTGQRYAAGPAQTNYYVNVLERIEQLPSVRAAAVSTDMPLSEEQPYQETRFQVEGRPALPLSQRPTAYDSSVSPSYFHTLGIPLRRGRLFGSQDTLRTGTKIVVNEALVGQVFPREDPIGKRISRSTIIGVVGNVRGSHLGAEPDPLIYFCSCQNNSPFQTQMALFVRTAGDPHKAVRDIQAQAYSVDRNEPVFDVATMDERLSDSLAPQRFHLLLVGTFAVIALVLSAIGIYGVMTYLVARRRREIGIRLAVGAQPVQIVNMVTGESFLLILIALAAGLAGAGAVTRYLKSILYGVTALDAVSFTATPLFLAAIALTASFFPARKAAETDPTVILREE
jgi:putative ABC transport system permease protein